MKHSILVALLLAAFTAQASNDLSNKQSSNLDNTSSGFGKASFTFNMKFEGETTAQMESKGNVDNDVKTLVVK